MKTIEQIRLVNARRLVKMAGNQQAFIDKVGIASALGSGMVGAKPRKNIGSAMARRIEKAFCLEEGWLDQEHITDDPDAVAMAEAFQALYEAADDKRRLKMLAQMDMVVSLAKSGSEAQD